MYSPIWPLYLSFATATIFGVSGRMGDNQVGLYQFSTKSVGYGASEA